jgi:nitrite reductase (NADH) large subunit
MDPRLPLIEVRDWGRRPRRVALNRPVVVGRDCDGEILADSEVSRAHLRLVRSPTALSVVDLESRNGTTLNGVTLTGRAALGAGDVLCLGRSEIIVLFIPTERTAEPSAPEPDHDATRMRIVSAPPPPPPAADATPSRAVAVTERLLGIDPTGERELFPSYTELPTKVPLSVWHAIRAISIITYLGVVVTLFVRPASH